MYGGELTRKETNKGYGSFYSIDENGDFNSIEKRQMFKPKNTNRSLLEF